MYRRILFVLGCFLLTPAVLAAQPIDCRGPIARAQKEIDKITGDLQGMDKMMPKSEMTQLHGLVEEAKRLNDEASRGCTSKSAAYDKARAIAHATASNGYATAADILHFHYMEEPMGGATKSN